MKKILVTGGCRSGKSRYALNYANQHFSRKLYLATAEVLDEEMAVRVEHHQKDRGPDWETCEEPVEVVEKISQYSGKVEVILLDCLTLWLSNLLIRWNDDLKVMDEIEKLTGAMETSLPSFILVSNEVGMGIVPADPLARRFRDLAGRANQRIAEVADRVVLMVSGIPVFVKGEE
jgi:adenosylcobinamide kinase / adenosylcobinamide-phosphate guanylyltransferase